MPENDNFTQFEISTQDKIHEVAWDVAALVHNRFASPTMSCQPNRFLELKGMLVVSMNRVLLHYQTQSVSSQTSAQQHCACERSKAVRNSDTLRLAYERYEENKLESV